jgi:hypothetical protein
MKNRDSSVSTVTKLGAERPGNAGSITGRGKRVSLHCVWTASGVPLSLLSSAPVNFMSYLMKKVKVPQRLIN